MRRRVPLTAGVEDGEVAFIHALPLQVVRELQQTALMGFLPVPAFELYDVFVVVVGDNDVQPLFFGDLGLLKVVPFAIDDGL